MLKEQVLIALLRSVVCGGELTEELKNACTEEMLEAVCSDAKRHDLAHLVSCALRKLDLPESESLAKCQMAAKQAIFRYMRLDLAYAQICDTLEKTEIPFIPLKGSVLRNWYPEAWMRTSCDIDILVHPEDLDRAVEALKASLQFTLEGKGDHDVSLYSPGGVHLELHYETMVESDQICNSNSVLSRIWEDATPVKPGAHHCQMSDGMFYFYHIAHLAKHIANGGCGVRPFLDLWVMQHLGTCQPDAQLLEEGGLTAVANAAQTLSEAWFSNAPAEPMTDLLAQFVLSGGVYGTMENNVAMQQQKQGSKLRYAISKIILPYETIKFHYPILQKRKWLTPVFQVVRWMNLLFRGGVKRSVRQLQLNASSSCSEIQSANALLQYLGLK